MLLKGLKLKKLWQAHSISEKIKYWPIIVCVVTTQHNTGLMLFTSSYKWDVGPKLALTRP